MLRACLVALIAWSLWTGLRVRNPDPPIPDLGGLEVPGELGFFTRDSDGRTARYRFDAIRYALAPRKVSWDRPPKAPHLITDARRPPPGYEPVARHGELVLLRRR